MEFYETIKNKPHDLDVVNKDNYMWENICGKYYPCMIISEDLAVIDEVGVEYVIKRRAVKSKATEDQNTMYWAVIGILAIWIAMIYLSML